MFKEWLDEGIIEEVRESGSDSTHYLPYRPVIKESSLTTKIRPVFDASARERNKPSLNQCLEKGPNLIELIPSLLIRFRERRLGVVSDIRKAFLQISVNENDRNFLRFLWVDSDGNEVIFRHKRVVFGVSSSPFLLAATIDYHLTESLKTCLVENHRYTADTILRLQKSFYVDNCVTSLSDDVSLKRFIEEASAVMADGKFDLRGWFTGCTESEQVLIPVLGLHWHVIH